MSGVNGDPSVEKCRRELGNGLKVEKGGKDERKNNCLTCGLGGGGGGGFEVSILSALVRNWNQGKEGETCTKDSGRNCFIHPWEDVLGHLC